MILVPEDSNFAVCAYRRTCSKKRTVAIFYSGNHFDFLQPEDAQPYPDDILNVDVDPTGGFLVGGASEAGTVFTAASSGPRTVWTKRALTGAAKTTSSTAWAVSNNNNVSVWTQAPKTPRATSDRVGSRPADGGHSVPARGIKVPSNHAEAGNTEEASDAESQDLQGCDFAAPKPASSSTWRVCPYKAPPPPKDLTFKCKLCPFKKICKSAANFRVVRHKHTKKAHDGVGLPGPLLQPRMQRLPSRISTGDWRCPLCKEGLRKETLAMITKPVLCQIRLRHWKATHQKEVTREKWTALLKAQPKPKRPKLLKEAAAAHVKACRSRALTKAVLAEVQNPRFPTLTMFAWPRCKTRGSKQRVSVEHAWSCNKCGRAIRMFERSPSACDQAVPSCT